MKRLYFAFGIVIITITLGIVEIFAINNLTNLSIAGIEKAKISVKNNETNKALSIMNKTTDFYNDESNKFIPYLYAHKSVEEIKLNLEIASKCLENNDTKNFDIYCCMLTDELKGLQENEMLNLKNIL